MRHRPYMSRTKFDISTAVYPFVHVLLNFPRVQIECIARFYPHVLSAWAMIGAIVRWSRESSI
jgi:hypothetical protein